MTLSTIGRKMHICPLQLGLIKRLIVRYSNPGELVYDPFGGIMSVPLVALQEGRHRAGIPLHRVSTGNTSPNEPSFAWADAT